MSLARIGETISKKADWSPGNALYTLQSFKGQRLQLLSILARNTVFVT